MSHEKNSMNILKLIQPELLSVEELVDILRERSVSQELLNQEKDKLVSLFRRVALPLPQREHRQNYRGMLLTKLQKKTERLKICISATNDTKNYTIGILGNPTSNDSSKEEQMVNDRLKPPPDLINYERKKIRLNRVSSKVEQSSSELDKIVINKRKYSDSSDSGSDKNTLNVIKKPIDKRVNSPTNIDVPSEVDPENLHLRVRSNGTKSEKPAKVSLKRNHLTSEVLQSNAEAESTSELTKKRKPITWP